MEIKPFRNWDQKLLTGIFRFPVSIIIAMIYAAFAAWSTHIKTFEIGHNLIAFFITGFFLSIATTLSLENKTTNHINTIITFVITSLWLLFWFFQPRKFDGDYMFYLSAMSLIAFVLAIFFGSYTRKGDDIPFWNFTANTFIKAIISGIFSGVLMGGIALAFHAIDILFKANIDNHIYSYLAILCFILFLPAYFLSNTPTVAEKQDYSLHFNKFLKIFSLYIILPILLIYTTILYSYLLKIVIQWQLPNGWVSWLVSVLGVGGFATVMLIHPFCEKVQHKQGILFSRYFPYAILPLLALMTIGIFRRFSDYGLTINRLLVILLNFWMYGIAIYFIFTRSKKIRIVFISFATISLLAAVGPWNIFSITRLSMHSQLTKTLKQHHLLINGKIDFSQPTINNLDSATFANIESALRYMSSTFGVNSIQPFFECKLTQSQLFILLGNIQDSYSAKDHQETELHITPQPMPISTEKFPYAIQVSFKIRGTINSADGITALSLERNTLTLSKDQQPYISIPLSNEIDRLKTRQSQQRINSIDATTIRGNNFKLIITQLNVELIHQPRIIQLEGILFYR